MSTTELERTNLEAHVDLCAERYKGLETRLENVEKAVKDLHSEMRRMHDENVKNHLLTRIPLKRVAQASEVASLVYFLATDESSYITGTYIPIDGGYLSS